MNAPGLVNALFRKWERLLFWGLSVALVATGLSWYQGLGQEEGRTVRAKSPPRPGSLLNADTAFAFRDSQPTATLEGTHPFSFVLEVDRGRGTGPAASGTKGKRRPWGTFRNRKKPTTVKVVKPAQTTKRPIKRVVTTRQAPQAPENKPPPPVAEAPKAPAPEQVVKVDPPKAPPPPKPKKKVTLTLGNSGFVGTPSGKRFALVRDEKAKTATFVAEGAALGDFEVEGVGTDKVDLVGPDGKKHSLAIGKQKKIVID